MSTEATKETPTPTHNHPVHGIPKVVREIGVTYELCEFESGNNKGFIFYKKNFDDYKSMLAHYSEDIILTVVNRQLDFALRQKASNSVPPDEDAKNKALARGGEAILVVDVAAAKNYTPGERDLTSISGCDKKIRELMGEVKELREKQKVEPENAESIEARIGEMKVQIMALRNKIVELTSKSEDVENL